MTPMADDALIQAMRETLWTEMERESGMPGKLTWDKPIYADRWIATPEQQQKAWTEWVGLPVERRTSAALANAIRQAAAPCHSEYDSDRIADRMLQRAHKASAIA
jgi:hypothetical protein